MSIFSFGLSAAKVGLEVYKSCTSVTNKADTEEKDLYKTGNLHWGIKDNKMDVINSSRTEDAILQFTRTTPEIPFQEYTYNLKPLGFKNPENEIKDFDNIMVTQNINNRIEGNIIDGVLTSLIASLIVSGTILIYKKISLMLRRVEGNLELVLLAPANIRNVNIRFMDDNDRVIVLDLVPAPNLSTNDNETFSALLPVDTCKIINSIKNLQVSIKGDLSEEHFDYVSTETRL